MTKDKISNNFGIESREECQQKVNELKQKYKYRRTFLTFIEELEQYRNLPENKSQEVVFVEKGYISPSGFRLWKMEHNIREGKLLISEEEREYLETIGFVWDIKKYQFEKFKRKLLEYKLEYGNLIIDKNYVTTTGYALGKYVVKLRTDRKLLTEQQFKELDEMGFVWKIELARQELRFMKFKEELDEYRQLFGDLMIPFSYVSQSGYKLGHTVSSVRSGNIKLTKEQRIILTEMGFIWNRESHQQFVYLVNSLKQYKEEFGNLKVPVDYVNLEGFELGHMVSKVRKNQIHLNSGQVKVLDEMGFDWDIEQCMFDSLVSNLREYKEKFGDLYVPLDFEMEEGDNLGWQVLFMRNKGKESFSEDNQQKLDELNFCWDEKEESELQR